jgi:hypothetical protein
VKKCDYFTMSLSPGPDPLIFGHRLRHYRRAGGHTLDQLGQLVGRPGERAP